MDNDEFQDEVLQRLTRIETKIEGSDEACILCSKGIRERLDENEDEIEKVRDKVHNIEIKTAAVGGAAGVLGALGISGFDWLAGLFR